MAYNCLICKDDGFRINNGNVQPCECVKQKRLILLYKEIGLPLRFRDVQLEQYSIKQDAYGADLSPVAERQKIIAKDVVVQFIKSVPNMLNGNPFTYDFEDRNNQKHTLRSYSLVLMGQKQSGKSMLAACIAKGCVKQGHLPYYLEWSEIINACFDYNIDAGVENITSTLKYEDILNILTSSRIIILDNLDKSYEKSNVADEDKLTPSVRRKLDAMFSGRAKSAIPTVFTTDQNEVEVGGKYGPVLANILDDAIKIELPTLGRSKNPIELKKVN